MSSVFIGLGSNINPEENLRKAAAMLRERFPGIRFSSVYRTAPREREDQPEFFNAVAAVAWGRNVLAAREILDSLKDIECALGKNPPYRFGPRTIDLDLLLYGDVVTPSIEEWGNNSQLATRNSQLMLPHPRMHERRFVLEPLCELFDPQERHPVLGKAWEQLLSEVQTQKCEKTTATL